MPFGQKDEVYKKCSFIFWKSASLALRARCFQPYGKCNLSYDHILHLQNCGACSRSSHPGSHMVLVGSEALMSLHWQVPFGDQVPAGVAGDRDQRSPFLNPEAAVSLPGPSVHAKTSLVWPWVCFLSAEERPSLQGKRFLLFSPAEIPPAKSPKAAATYRGKHRRKRDTKSYLNQSTTLLSLFLSFFFLSAFQRRILPSVDSIISCPEMTLSLEISISWELAL